MYTSLTTSRAQCLFTCFCSKENTSQINKFSRILSYSKAIWYLYRFGRKSEQLENNHDYVEQKRHKSVLFLSKAGRFFTVGASGFVINYLVSLLVANTVSNIWYIHANIVWYNNFHNFKLYLE